MIFKKEPLVSVHIVTYNSAKFIRETLESTLCQEYPNFEIIVSDDASLDETPSILREYAKKYPEKIKIILNNINMGITKNCNSALKICKGKYVAFLDGDDVMLPDKLHMQTEYMENHLGCSISYHRADVFNSETGKSLFLHKTWIRDKPRSGDVRVLLEYGNFLPGCTVMIRRDRLPGYGFDENYPVCSDFMLYVQTLLLNGGDVHYIPKMLSRYRKHKAGISNGSSEFYKQAVLDALNGCNWIMVNYPLYSHLIVRLYGVILRSVRRFEDASYLNILWQSFKIQPSLKVLIGMGCYVLSFGRIRV